MPTIIVTLNEVLEKIDVTPYKLAKESKIRPNTIYEIMENKKKMINIDALVAIISTLNELSIQQGYTYKFDIGDVVKYIED
jgi:predicted transcriptional regulator